MKDDRDAGSKSSRLWFFFDHAFEAMVVFRVADDVILAANDAYLELTGYERDEVIGRSGIELGLWAETPDRGAAIEAMRRGEFDGSELTFPTKSGDIRLIEARARIIDLDGEEVVLGAARDVTESRALLERLDRLSHGDRRDVADEIREGLMQSLTAVLLRLETTSSRPLAPSLRAELDAAAAAVRVTVARTRVLLADLQRARSAEPGSPPAGADGP